MKNHVLRQVRLCSLVEQLGDPANRVVPFADKVAGLGLPRLEVTFNVGSYERASLEAAKKAHQIVFDKIEVTESHHYTEIFGAGHIMGTCRMGASKADSVRRCESSFARP